MNNYTIHIFIFSRLFFYQPAIFDVRQYPGSQNAGYNGLCSRFKTP